MNPRPARAGRLACLIVLVATPALAWTAAAQAVRLDLSPAGRHQVIDGFGAHQGSTDRDQAWWQQLFYDDLRASIYRVDMTPRFVSPYSDFSYYSPWFMGSSVDSPLNIEDPDNPNGPENNRVRTYTDASDYGRRFGGRNAPIAVMGPDIDANVRLLAFDADGAVAAGAARRAALGDFKLVGSIWSPAPWLKRSSGNQWEQNWWPGPVAGAAWPFIWGGNFAGGVLDVSGTPRPEFDDRALGGTGPTSALTQFARGVAAYLRGYQNHHGVRFYAFSIQNELNFEEFYNSMKYPLAEHYLLAVKAVRAELDRYDDLRDIQIMGPEDLLGGDVWGMWQYGGGATTSHKNLQFLRHIEADPEASAAVDFYNIHGYDSDGVSAAAATATLWAWWAHGWSESPVPGAIPDDVRGFTAFGKKSWMTETSGEQAPWLVNNGAGFPSEGAWGIALRIHQALTVGRQSAWLYWTFTEEENGAVTPSALTSRAEQERAPKYVAAKHFFRYVRPGAVRVEAAVEGASSILASAYVHAADQALTVVLLNASAAEQTATLHVPGVAGPFEAYTSSAGRLWQASTVTPAGGAAAVTLPAFSVATLHATGVAGVGRDEGAQPPGTRLGEGYPNPFGSTATVPFTLGTPAHVRLDVFDVTGRRVASLVDGPRAAGAHAATLDAAALPAGVYLCRLQAGAHVSYRKLIRLR